MKIYDVVSELKGVRLRLPVKQVLPDDAVISDYEAELGISFSDDYKFFVKEASDSIYNGKDALQLTVNRDSSRELASAVIDAREQGMPESWIPICEDNGNYYCLLEDGSIRYWSHDGLSAETWPNLASWIKNVWIDGE
ncbi:SMI1/KNR4 family protein [Pseudomonas spelaei]|nr:SMI1/KNR4 family protein [Pseudomonas spelaei]